MHPNLVIQCEHLNKRFGQLKAVDGLNLEVRQGEILGFLGPNGAGKSSTINMICGLLRPDSGSVKILGNDLRKYQSMRHKIGLCPQENIFYGPIFRGDLLSDVGIHQVKYGCGGCQS